VIAFNGYAGQYKKEPIAVKKRERIRMFVLNSGPSIWSAFHVIGTVFDTTMIEGVEGHHAQTVNLAPSQGGWVEFTLDEEGTYPLRHPRVRGHGEGLRRGPGDRERPHTGMKH
jgi:nitrite reductase (NO-forming)